MSSLEKLIRERKKKEDNRPKELTQEELDEQVRKWTDFYRNNWDLYATEELGLPLKEFQKYAFYEIADSKGEVAGYFVARAENWRGINVLVIADYRYNIKRDDVMDFICLAAKTKAPKT